MIKKLYSSDLTNPDSDDELDDILKANRPKRVEKLDRDLTKRAIFSYKYRRLGCIKYFSWCCCGRIGGKREDFLFRDAKEKLSNETDLLEMVKNMRIFKFTSDIILKPRQRDLVNFFDSYKLRANRPVESSKPYGFSKRIQDGNAKRKYTGNRGDDISPSNVEDLLAESNERNRNDTVSRIMQAVDATDPEDNAID